MIKQHLPSTTNDTLILSGLTELATGALTGWPYALAVNDADGIRKLGIQSIPRLRQWHLDLIALGSLSVVIGTAVPNLPRHIAWPLTIGAWTNANAFGLLAVRPDWKDSTVYKTAVVGSFAAMTWAVAPSPSSPPDGNGGPKPQSSLPTGACLRTSPATHPLPKARSASGSGRGLRGVGSPLPTPRRARLQIDGLHQDDNHAGPARTGRGDRARR